MQRLLDETITTATIDTPPGEITREEVYTDLGFATQTPSNRPYVVVNMVMTLDGKVVIGGPGTTRLIGSRMDHYLMTRIEAQCDAVLFGATLLREDNPGYPWHDEARQARRVARGVRAEPLWAAVSTLGAFPTPPRMFEGGPDRTALFVSNATPPETLEALASQTKVIARGEHEVPLDEMLHVFRHDLGVRTLCCLGGAALNARMLALGLVDEVFVTIAPKIQNGRGGVTMFEGVAFPADALAHLALKSVYSHESELYLRYRTT